MFETLNACLIEVNVAEGGQSGLDVSQAIGQLTERGKDLLLDEVFLSEIRELLLAHEQGRYGCRHHGQEGETGHHQHGRQQLPSTLGLVATVKLLGATIPIGVAYGRMPWPRLWRGTSWGGGLLLVTYGGVNTIVALAVLAGAIRPEGGYDADAMMGHAYLWDPLFFLWGATLVLSLWLSRPTVGAARRGSRSGSSSEPA